MTVFTVKDWRNATTHEGGGDTTTPISAAALEDLETRVTSSGGRTITATGTQTPLTLQNAVGADSTSALTVKDGAGGLMWEMYPGGATYLYGTVQPIFTLVGPEGVPDPGYRTFWQIGYDIGGVSGGADLVLASKGIGDWPGTAVGDFIYVGHGREDDGTEHPPGLGIAGNVTNSFGTVGITASVQIQSQSEERSYHNLLLPVWSDQTGYAIALRDDTLNLHWHINREAVMQFNDRTQSNESAFKIDPYNRELKIWHRSAVDTDHVIQVRETSDTEPRFQISNAGRLEWGPGGVTATDTYIWRHNDTYIKVNSGILIDGVIGVNNATAGAPGGSATKNFAVYDETGTLEGYVPLYN